MSDSPSNLTQLLTAAARGDLSAAEGFFCGVYDQLRRMAAAQMSREAAGNTLQATALVHEAWLRLGGEDQQGWNGRAHFFGAAAEAMRRILVESARRKKAVRHGGMLGRVNVDDVEIETDAKDTELLAVHDALDSLAKEHPRKAELVKLRYFVGLSLEEAAKVLGISVPTAGRDWTYARAWLQKEMAGK